MSEYSLRVWASHAEGQWGHVYVELQGLDGSNFSGKSPTGDMNILSTANAKIRNENSPHESRLSDSLLPESDDLYTFVKSSDTITLTETQYNSALAGLNSQIGTYGLEVTIPDDYNAGYSNCANFVQDIYVAAGQQGDIGDLFTEAELDKLGSAGTYVDLIYGSSDSIFSFTDINLSTDDDSSPYYDIFSEYNKLQNLLLGESKYIHSNVTGTHLFERDATTGKIVEVPLEVTPETSNSSDSSSQALDLYSSFGENDQAFLEYEMNVWDEDNNNFTSFNTFYTSPLTKPFSSLGINTTYDFGAGGWAEVDASNSYLDDLTFDFVGTKYTLVEDGAKIALSPDVYAGAWSIATWINGITDDLDYAATLKSPLVLDLDGGGVELIHADDGVYFDIDNDNFIQLKMVA